MRAKEWPFVERGVASVPVEVNTYARWTVCGWPKGSAMPMWPLGVKSRLSIDRSGGDRRADRAGVVSPATAAPDRSRHLGCTASCDRVVVAGTDRRRSCDGDTPRGSCHGCQGQRSASDRGVKNRLHGVTMLHAWRRFFASAALCCCLWLVPVRHGLKMRACVGAVSFV